MPRGNERPVGGLHRHEQLVGGQVSLGDDTETTVIDVGTLSGPTVELIHSAYLNLTTNGQNNVDFKLKVDINGSLTQIGGTQNISADGTLDLSNFDVQTPVASSRVVLTATGDQASPGTAGTIDYTVEHSTAT